jgi:hypothetical protein
LEARDRAPKQLIGRNPLKFVLVHRIDDLDDLSLAFSAPVVVLKIKEKVETTASDECRASGVAARVQHTLQGR